MARGGGRLEVSVVTISDSVNVGRRDSGTPTGSLSVMVETFSGEATPLARGRSMQHQNAHFTAGPAVEGFIPNPSVTVG